MGDFFDHDSLQFSDVKFLIGNRFAAYSEIDSSNGSFCSIGGFCSVERTGHICELTVLD